MSLKEVVCLNQEIDYSIFYKLKDLPSGSRDCDSELAYNISKILKGFLAIYSCSRTMIAVEIFHFLTRIIQ